MNDAPTEPVAAEGLLNPETYRPLYPVALLDDLAKELRIDSQESRSRFEDTVLFAAGIYKATKNSLKRKAPRHRENEALQKIAKKAKELDKAIVEAQQTGLAYPRLFACGLPKAKAAAVSSSSPKFQQIFEILVRGDTEHMAISPHAIQEAVQFLSLAAQTAALDASPHYAANKNWPVEQWIGVLGRSWKEFTDLTFTVGRFDPEFGYENMTLYVLEKLMKPLDRAATRKQIESALRKVTRRPQTAP